jgi:hypothetical protein
VRAPGSALQAPVDFFWGALKYPLLLLKLFRPRSFSKAVNPISGSAALTGATYDFKVARKMLESVEQQGDQAVRLIQAAAATPAPMPAGSVGRLLDVRG